MSWCCFHQQIYFVLVEKHVTEISKTSSKKQKQFNFVSKKLLSKTHTHYEPTNLTLPYMYVFHSIDSNQYETLMVKFVINF